MARFNYFNPDNFNNFEFFRIPKKLIKDESFKGLSVEAMFMYGILLDRMSLSFSNGNDWKDEQGRVFIIYPIKSLAKDLSFGKDKTMKLLTELQDIGLIERKRIGLGNPDRIYVKDFSSKCDDANMSEDSNGKISSNNSSDTAFGNSELQNTENQNSAIRKSDIQEFGNSEPNNNNINNTEVSNTDYPINHIVSSKYIGQNDNRVDGCDEMDNYENAINMVKTNIEYDFLLQDGYAQDVLDEIVELITDIVSVQREKVRINGIEYKYQTVKHVFLKLNNSHIRYIFKCLENSASEIKNIRSYLLTTLYNAPHTMKNHYKAMVNHDLYGADG